MKPPLFIYGQLFLLAGLAAWARYGRVKKDGWLALAGLSWGLAVACRYNLPVSVIVMMVLALIAFGREGGWRQG